MKIAIASEKNNLESNVSVAIGRAAYFLIFENKELIKTIKNPFAVGGGGAGLAVAQMLSNENINILVGGKFGGNIIQALTEQKIDHKEASDKTVKQIIEEL